MNVHKTMIGVIVILGSAGCTLQGTTGVQATPTTPTSATASTGPELVAVDEQQDVWVVQDADAPTYYANGSYWSYRNSTWYQSSTFNGGWIAISFNLVPPTIVHRDHRQYVHYRGTPYARHRRGPHGGYGGGPRSYDHHDHRGHR
jgi:hypothetical protein